MSATKSKKLQRFLDAIRVIRELSPRSQDVVMGLGERLSARVLAAVLLDRGLPSRFVDLAQVVPENEKEVDPAFSDGCKPESASCVVRKAASCRW